MKHRIKLGTIIIYAILISAAFICVLPFVHLLAVSFSGSSAVSAGKVTFFPVDFTWASYIFTFKGGKFLKALAIAIIRIILGAGLNIIMVVLTAYPLSKSSRVFKGRNIYMGYFFITMLVSAGIVPTYLVVVKMGLINSIWSMVLPYAVPVYNVIIMMNFMRGLPEEIEEAAELDGANRIQILFKVVLPLLKPAIATIALFCIVWHWNDWFSATIYINDPNKYPLATYLQSLLTNFEQIAQFASGDYKALTSQLNAQTGRAAQLFLGALPMIIAYPFLQKYFAKGLILGSVKE